MRVDGEQLQRVVGERDARRRGLLLSTLLPGVQKCDHVVDIDLAGAAARVVNALAGVGVSERAGLDAAVVQVGLGGQVAGEDPVARVATTDVDPAIPELLAAIARLRRAALDRQPGERSRGRTRAWLVVAAVVARLTLATVCFCACLLAFALVMCRCGACVLVDARVLTERVVVPPHPAAANAAATSAAVTIRRLTILKNTARPESDRRRGDRVHVRFVAQPGCDRQRYFGLQQQRTGLTWTL